MAQGFHCSASAMDTPRDTRCRLLGLLEGCLASHRMVRAVLGLLEGCLASHRMVRAVLGLLELLRMRRWRALVNSHWRGSPYPRRYKSGQCRVFLYSHSQRAFQTFGVMS
jgi:hypothetical protein